jgi:hypothetical protein
MVKSPDWKRILSALNQGTKTAVNLAKATATAAMVPVCITANSDQPYKKPISGLKASLRYTYCPPDLGNIADNSAYDVAAITVSIPVVIHTRISNNGLANAWATPALTMYTPEPIIEPITRNMPVLRPTLFFCIGQ